MNELEARLVAATAVTKEELTSQLMERTAALEASQAALAAARTAATDALAEAGAARQRTEEVKRDLEEAIAERNRCASLLYLLLHCLIRRWDCGRLRGSAM